MTTSQQEQVKCSPTNAFKIMMDVSRIASKNSGQLPFITNVWNNDRMFNDIIHISSKKWQCSEISNGIAARCVCVYFKRCSLVYRWNARHVKWKILSIYRVVFGTQDSLTFVCIAILYCVETYVTMILLYAKTIVHVIMNNDNKPPSLIRFWEFSDGRLHPQLGWPYKKALVQTFTCVR